MATESNSHEQVPEIHLDLETNNWLADFNDWHKKNGKEVAETNAKMVESNMKKIAEEKEVSATLSDQLQESSSQLPQASDNT